MAGSIPLSTLRARVEFGFARAAPAQGHIGIKVWINNGDYLDSDYGDEPASTQGGPSPGRGRRPGGRHPRR